MLGTNPNQAGLNLEDLRVIVVTGPDTLGRQQVVTGLRESEQQLLDIEEVAVTNQQEGVGGDDGDPPANHCSLLVSRQLKRDRATNLAVFPNTTFPPNLPHVKGEGESEQVRRKWSNKRWSGCSVNLLVSLVGFSCHKLWQRRCWLQQGFFSKTSHLLNIEHLHSLSTQAAH